MGLRKSQNVGLCVACCIVSAAVRNSYPSSDKKHCSGHKRCLPSQLAADMSFPLSTFFLAQGGVNAMPIPITDQHTSPPDGCNGWRTLLNIVWNCIFTIFLCTYVSLHPNVPGPNEGFVAVTLRRLKVMVMALLAPEFNTLWAIRQWFAARAAKKERGELFFEAIGLSF